MAGVKINTRNERSVITRAMRSLMDKGMGAEDVARVSLDCIMTAATDPERCGHVVVDLASGVYRCGRNAGHDGEHGRRK